MIRTRDPQIASLQTELRGKLPNKVQIIPINEK